MSPTTIHNPDRYMAELRQILSQGRKRIGLLVGAGAPMAIRVDSLGAVTGVGGEPLIPDISGLTAAVIATLSDDDRQTITRLEPELTKPITIEDLLTRVRRLAQVIGPSKVHALNGSDYEQLGKRLCSAIGNQVCAQLPPSPNAYTELVSWIAGTQRQHSVELFTPNYDLLMEQAFERARVPYFDGFTGSDKPFFDPASVSSDELPARWSRLWKLHGSLGWKALDDRVVRSGGLEATDLIYPDHLKYDQVTRLPYSALFDRLRQFLTSPDTLLIATGFSFGDAHICAVLDESLAVNAHTAVFAFQYQKLGEESAATAIAMARPNMSVYARDAAIISGVQGYWQPGDPENTDWLAIRKTFWDADHHSGPFLLGDFRMLAQFLALTQAQQLVTPVSNSGNGSGDERTSA